MDTFMKNHLKPMRIAAIITHKPACAAISMGFNGFQLFLCGFSSAPFKTHANHMKSSLTPLKTHAYSNK